jgi:hypothetical protein
MIEFTSIAEPTSAVTSRAWPRLAALALAVAATGLPVNHLFGYALLLIATVLIFSGRVTLRAAYWLSAIAAVAVAALLPLLLSPSPIAQGENVFLPGRTGNVLERGLPGDVYRFMQSEFDALYPLQRRCQPQSPGCQVNRGFPARLYAFSADGVFGSPRYSRAVRAIDFSDPVWLRLGFINDNQYNWSTEASDLHRADRDKRVWMGLRRWHIAMPWFVMYQFPADYQDASLCWRGDVLWPGADGRYTPLHHLTLACRTLGAGDIGSKIFGVAIKPDSLAMTLHPPAAVEARLLACSAVTLLAIIVLLVLLVRVRPRDTMKPFVLIALSLVVIAVIDASFIGGWRPMDGGDDGLFYTGTGRVILQHLLHGDVMAALAGGENVYYYGGPGLRYFRALEMILFGDTNLGYLSLVLVLPLVLLGLSKRFLSDAFSWRLALIFVAVPIGEIFGTSFLDYAKWAARGFADPAAHILTIWGIWVVVGPREGLANRAAVAAGGALLLALAVFTKPVVAPIVGIVIGGAGLAALAQRQWRRAAGLCIGFLPVLLMPLHNWYFGHQLVLLSSNAQLPNLLIMPPSAWLAALAELARLDFSGPYFLRALAQLGAWLSGPGEQLAFVPFNAAAVAIVAYVTVRGRGFDPWLRLIGVAVLAEYAVDLIYAATPRYFFGTWLLSAVIVAVFIERRLPAWLDKRGWQRAKFLLERSLGAQPAGA